MAKDDPRDILSFEPVGSHVQNGSLSSAVTLTPPTGATKLMIQANTENVRITMDGTTPTSSLGFVLTAGDPPIIFQLGSGTTVKVIEAASGAVIDYQWAKG